MSQVLIKHLSNSPLLQNKRDFLKLTCGWELELRTIDGKRLIENAFLSNFSNGMRRVQSKSSTNYPNIATSEQPIDLTVIHKATDSHQTQIYQCANQLWQILIPILFKDDLIGFMFTYESLQSKLKTNNPQLLAKNLENFIKSLVEIEICPITQHLGNDTQLSPKQELLSNVVRYIKNNYHSNELTLKEVSDHNGVSYYYLSRIFKDQLNTTFAKFRNKVRLDAASKMLTNKSLSVSQISYACGFDDPAYFCKVFKNSFGKSPMTYRQNAASNRIPKDNIQSTNHSI